MLRCPRGDISDHTLAVVPSHPEVIVEGDIVVIEAKLLAADRALDQAWRGGVGVAKAAAQAKELGDSLTLDVVMQDATTIVSDHQSCSPEEALSRLVFVSQRTNRRLREIAHEVVAVAAAEHQELAIRPERLYRFTL